jgi:adenosylhomocysteinase
LCLWSTRRARPLGSSTRRWHLYVFSVAVDPPRLLARLHLDPLVSNSLGSKPEQAAYIGLPVEGPYKSDHYRY